MNLKLQKIAISSVLILLTLPVYAQLRLGFRAGLNASNQNLTQSPNRFADAIGFRLEDQSFKLSFHAGVIGDYEINRVMSFQSGLIYNDKGTRFFYKIKDDGLKVVIAETVNIGYLEVPLMFVYRLETSRYDALRLGFGGYLGLALLGKYRVVGRGDGERLTETAPMNFGSSPSDDYKGSDAGVGLEAAYETNGLIFGAGLNYGLVDIKNANKNTRNIVLQAHVSYLFDAGGGGSYSKKRRRRR